LLDIVAVLYRNVRMNREGAKLVAENQFADKRRRQAVWNADCDRKHLSVQQKNAAASIFPSEARIKVLAWPKL
jgi:hypothetical protein